MYCIKCGVGLADTEHTCPLCGTRVYHPDLPMPDGAPLYPENKLPKVRSGRKALSGAIIILFLIPAIVSFFSDLQMDGKFDWFGYVAGGLALGYIVIALPLWFRKPNPVVFVPCDFAAAALYMHYIDWATKGGWFWTFSLPLTAGLALITCAVISLERYVGKGRLYIAGGTLAGLGVWVLAVEYLLRVTFGLPFIGWSVYPLIVLALLGGLLIYLAVNRTAREALARRFFV